MKRIAVTSTFIVLSIAPSISSAQDGEQEIAGQSRQGYAWGSGDGQETRGPVALRPGRWFASLGIGASIRLVEYETLAQDRFAPPYLSLRLGHFFEGEGDFQHGLTLGFAPNLSGDGSLSYGIDPFGQWTIAPGYAVRYWLDNWIQLAAYASIPIAFAGNFVVAGGDLQVGAIIKPWNGFGFYANAGISMFFAQDVHPLVSLEGGVVLDYEVFE